MMRIVLSLAIALMITCLATACDTKSKEEATAKPKEKAPAEQGAEKPKGDAPEEELLAAMKTVADLLDQHKGDPDASIGAVKAYIDANQEHLRHVVEKLRAKVDAMSPEDQDVFWKENTSRAEYQLWDGAMRRFEDTHPDHYDQLEAATDTIQSAGADNLIEAPTAPDKEPTEEPTDEESAPSE